MCVSCRQHISGSYFFILSGNLCFLVGVIRLFAFNIIIGIVGSTFAIVLCVLYASCHLCVCACVSCPLCLVLSIFSVSFFFCQSFHFFLSFTLGISICILLYHSLPQINTNLILVKYRIFSTIQSFSLVSYLL